MDQKQVSFDGNFATPTLLEASARLLYAKTKWLVLDAQKETQGQMTKWLVLDAQKETQGLRHYNAEA